MGIETVVKSAPVSGVQFVAVGLDDPLAGPLLAELAVEYSERYGGTPELITNWLVSAPEQFAPPGGGLFVGLLDGVPVTGGAFTRFDAERPRSSNASGPTAASGSGDSARRCWPTWRPRSPHEGIAGCI